MKCYKNVSNIRKTKTTCSNIIRTIKNDEHFDKTIYKSSVGSLIYLAVKIIKLHIKDRGKLFLIQTHILPETQRIENLLQVLL